MKVQSSLQSDLELMIINDMYINGYDPHNPEDIKLYWEERLN